MFTKKTILKKTVQVGSFTLLSRFLGIIREILMVHYLGASALSDVFLTAYKIPNSLRKIFAEGAMSAALIPTLVRTIKQTGKQSIIGLMTLAFLLFEGMVLSLCVFVIVHAEIVISFIAPGFSEIQIQQAVPILQIVMPFIFFISSSALFAGALQSVGHFFVPAISPALLNIVFISALVLCLSFDLPVIYLCWFILFGGFLQLILHIIAYTRLRFGFGSISKNDIKRFSNVLVKFFLCLPSISIMELSLFIDTSFASYLKKGSISLIYYANRFTGIPLGVFAIALSTVLLPHFSHVRSVKRLSFYLLESAKLVLWVTLPVALLMGFFSEKIFYTIFLSKKFTLPQVIEASSILCAFLIGLFFFSLNKILLNLYYALHVTWIPALVASSATVVNVILDALFITWLQGYGLALATSISAIVQASLFLFVLHKKFGFKIYIKPFIDFTLRFVLQITVFSIPFLMIYYGIEKIITRHAPSFLTSFLIDTIGFWFWVGPLSGLFFILLWFMRQYFGIRLYFME